MNRPALLLAALACVACDDSTGRISSPSPVPIPAPPPEYEVPDDLPDPRPPEVIEPGLDGPSTTDVEVRDVGGDTCLRLRDVDLCGAWRWNSDDLEYRGTGTIEMVLSAGIYRMYDADLTVTLDPPRLTGVANAGLPTTGASEDGEVDIVPVTVEDWADEETETSGIEVHGGMDLGVGVLDFVTEGFVLDAVGGVIDFAGDLGGLIVDFVFEDAAITFALFEPEEFIPRGPFFDGAGWYTPVLQAHLGIEGTARINPFPVHIDGRIMLDADVDDDGEPDYTDPLGWAMAGDGALRLDFQRAGWDFGFDLADAAFFWDLGEVPAGMLDLRAHGALPDLFEGTPLAVIRTQADAELHAHFGDVDDFLIHVDFDGRLGPIVLRDGVMQLDQDGIRGGMRIMAVPGVTDSFRVEGALIAGADPAFMGQVEARIAAFRTQASVTVSERGMAAETRLQIEHLGAIDLTGELHADPVWTGRGALSPAGLQLVDVDAELSRRGLSLAGRLGLGPFGEIDVSGHASPDTFELTGAGELGVAGFALADGHVAVTPNGGEIRGRLNILGAQVELMGRAAGADTALTGRATLRPAGFELADAQVTLSRHGVAISGRLHIPSFGSVAVSGHLQSDGRFSLSGRGELRPLGQRLADAQVTITHDGVRLSGRFRFGGAWFSVDGWVRSDGQFELNGATGGGGSAGPVSVRGEVRLQLRNSGVRARFHGRGCFDALFDDFCRGVELSVDSDGDVCWEGECVDVL